MAENKNSGMHRAKTWEIGLYALNNTSTNLYMMLVSYITYYLVGIIGVGVVFAGSFVTVMRIWDGVTDPIVGMLVDKTNGKFGKNRPFIVLGNVILFLTTALMFWVVPTIPQGIRLPVFIVIYMVYVLGYTAQCVVTKSAQSCLTNDPQQRPTFSMFDMVYNLIALSVWFPIYVSDTLMPKFTLFVSTNKDKILELIAQNPNLVKVLTSTAKDSKVPLDMKAGDAVNFAELASEETLKIVNNLDGYLAQYDKVADVSLSAMYNPEMFQHLHLLIGGLAAICAALAIFGLWRKDRSEYFGTGEVQKVTIKDYIDVMAHNRGIQMLVVAASSDKLSMSMQTNSTIMICVFGVMAGNYAYFGSQSAIAAIPTMLLGLLGMGVVAKKLGQKMALIVGTVGALASAAGMFLIFLLLDASTMVLPIVSLTNPATWGNLFVGSNWSLFGVLYILFWCLMKGFSGIASSIVIPMTADCADYEVYRSGKYVPGLMGTLFSFVDKVISSLASTLVSVMFAAIGFKDALPTVQTPYSSGIFWVVMACLIGAPCIGWILNVVAMKFYPLSKEKMESIQDRIAEIKAEAMKKNA